MGHISSHALWHQWNERQLYEPRCRGCETRLEARRDCTPASSASLEDRAESKYASAVSAREHLADHTKTYLSLSASTIVDVNPSIPDAHWLRQWSARQRSREAINPVFPEGVFDLQVIETGPVRCLFTIAELDEFARAAPKETFQGYLSVLITEVKLLECWKRRMLCCGECCNMPAYANALATTCKGCDKVVTLRLNPRIVGQVIDETAALGTGKLLFSDRAWEDLLGRGAEDLLKMSEEGVKYLSDRLLFCRVTLLFGWTGDEAVAGGRICVLGVRA